MFQAYPFHYFRIGIDDTDNIIVSNKTYLIVGKQEKDDNETWFLFNKELYVYLERNLGSENQ